MPEIESNENERNGQPNKENLSQNIINWKNNSERYVT